MKMEAIIEKFLEDETLLYGGGTAARKVEAELAEEGVSVFHNTVLNVQTIVRQVLAVQRKRDQS